MLEDTLQHIQQWMNLYCLNLNTDKTEFIYFGHYKQLEKCTVPEINICEDIVNRKESICYLGLTMDENLPFKNHISKINKNSSYNLFMMDKIHRYFKHQQCTTNRISSGYVKHGLLQWGVLWFSKLSVTTITNNSE